MERQDFKILLIEDQESFREAVIQLLGVYNEIHGVASLTEARNILQKQTFEVILLDKHLPDGDGIQMISEIKSECPNSVIIVLTSSTDFSNVKKSISLGADDYVIKNGNVIPDLLVRIPYAVAQAAKGRKLTQLNEQLKRACRHELVGKSKAAAELRLAILNQKGSKSTVLITGESGTGKETLARRLHAIEDNSKSQPFIAINCGAIPEQLIESELFGHRRGAFTGAIQDQIGKFELAHGGVLFLDEVGELPMTAQVKLLRVLQDREFYRVGGNKPIEVSCRIIAATNQDLEDLVQKKKFRSDLYYRLNVLRLNAPPLHSRLEDIPDLVQMFLVQADAAHLSVTDRAYAKLKNYGWPGNIRELGNTIERAVILARPKGSGRIDESHIILDRPGESIDGGARRIEMALPQDKEDISEEGFRDYLALSEREYLKKAIALHDGNIPRTADAIGMSRSNLFRKVALLKISKKIGEGRSVDTPAEQDLPGLRTALTKKLNSVYSLSPGGEG